MSDLFQIPSPPPTGPRRGRLATLFRVQLAVERWERRRRVAGRVVMAASLPMAYFLLAGRAVAGRGEMFVVAAWAVAFIAACLAGVGLADAQRLLDRTIAEAGGRRIEPRDGSGDDT